MDDGRNLNKNRNVNKILFGTSMYYIGLLDMFFTMQVCEISETTSDAWSMDVLASDTSERQMDRLLELEQVIYIYILSISYNIYIIYFHKLLKQDRFEAQLLHYTDED